MENIDAISFAVGIFFGFIMDILFSVCNILIEYANLVKVKRKNISIKEES